jgi:hypothetical protein
LIEINDARMRSVPVDESTELSEKSMVPSMMKPCFILQLKIDRDLAILRTGKFPFPEESLISQCSKLIHAEVSINRIDADYRW